MVNDDILQDRLNNLLSYHNILRRGVGEKELKMANLFNDLVKIRDNILPFMRSSYEIADEISKKNYNIMFEGAQGALLDVTYGTYPFVTSSNTISGQVAIGSSFGVGALNKTIGILKSYTTRVGSGPFPSELDDEIGKILQIKGDEIGTVTGRDRRCGWLDIALIRQNLQLSNIKEIILTKLDVLDELAKIKICTSYKINGKNYDYLPANIEFFDKIEPQYIEVDGWCQSTFGISNFNDLPENAVKYIKLIEKLTKVTISMIATGPERDHIIQR